MKYDVTFSHDRCTCQSKFEISYRVPTYETHCQEYSKESKINTFYTKVIFATRLRPTLVLSCFGLLIQNDYARQSTCWT